MLDSVKIGGFISRKRRELGMTQQHLADRLKYFFSGCFQMGERQHISKCGVAP